MKTIKKTLSTVAMFLTVCAFVASTEGIRAVYWGCGTFLDSFKSEFTGVFIGVVLTGLFLVLLWGLFYVVSMVIKWLFRPSINIIPQSAVVKILDTVGEIYYRLKYGSKSIKISIASKVPDVSPGWVLTILLIAILAVLLAYIFSQPAC